MAEKKESQTQKWAKKKKKDTTSKDVPGFGAARKTAKAIENRNAYLKSI